MSNNSNCSNKSEYSNNNNYINNSNNNNKSNKVGLDVVSLSVWFVVCVIVSVDKERNIEVS